MCSSDLFGTNRQGYLSRILVFEGAANLLLSLALIRSMGIVGVAVGTAIPSLVSQGWFVPRFVAKSMKISVRRLLIEGQSRGVICGVLVAVIGAAVCVVLPPRNWLFFFSGVAATCALSAPLIWRVGLLPDDRLALKMMLGRGPLHQPTSDTVV